jgi:hypothetical protein
MVSKGSGFRTNLIPAAASVDWIAAFCRSNCRPEENSSWNCNGSPALIPAPHSAGAVPGCAQVETALGRTFQP